MEEIYTNIYKESRKKAGLCPLVEIPQTSFFHCFRAGGFYKLFHCLRAGSILDKFCLISLRRRLVVEILQNGYIHTAIPL